MSLNWLENRADVMVRSKSSSADDTKPQEVPHHSGVPCHGLAQTGATA